MQIPSALTQPTNGSTAPQNHPNGTNKGLGNPNNGPDSGGKASHGRSTGFGQHPFLKVLLCNGCIVRYNERTLRNRWILDRRPHELACRWCANYWRCRDVFKCVVCPKIFCHECVRGCLPKHVFDAAKAADKWVCFAHNPEPIRPLQRYSAKVQALYGDPTSDLYLQPGDVNLIQLPAQHDLAVYRPYNTIKHMALQMCAPPQLVTDMPSKRHKSSKSKGTRRNSQPQNSRKKNKKKAREDRGKEIRTLIDVDSGDNHRTQPPPTTTTQSNPKLMIKLKRLKVSVAATDAPAPHPTNLAPTSAGHDRARAVPGAGTGTDEALDGDLTKASIDHFASEDESASSVTHVAKGIISTQPQPATQQALAAVQLTRASGQQPPPPPPLPTPRPQHARPNLGNAAAPPIATAAGGVAGKGTKINKPRVIGAGTLKPVAKPAAKTTADGRSTHYTGAATKSAHEKGGPHAQTNANANALGGGTEAAVPAQALSNGHTQAQAKTQPKAQKKAQPQKAKANGRPTAPEQPHTVTQGVVYATPQPGHTTHARGQVTHLQGPSTQAQTQTHATNHALQKPQATANMQALSKPPSMSTLATQPQPQPTPRPQVISQAQPAARALPHTQPQPQPTTQPNKSHTQTKTQTQSPVHVAGARVSAIGSATPTPPTQMGITDKATVGKVTATVDTRTRTTQSPQKKSHAKAPITAQATAQPRLPTKAQASTSPHIPTNHQVISHPPTAASIGTPTTSASEPNPKNPTGTKDRAQPVSRDSNATTATAKDTESTAATVRATAQPNTHHLGSQASSLPTTNAGAKQAISIISTMATPAPVKSNGFKSPNPAPAKGTVTAPKSPRPTNKPMAASGSKTITKVHAKIPAAKVVTKALTKVTVTKHAGVTSTDKVTPTPQLITPPTTTIITTTTTTATTTTTTPKTSASATKGATPHPQAQPEHTKDVDRTVAMAVNTKDQSIIMVSNTTDQAVAVVGSASDTDTLRTHHTAQLRPSSATPTGVPIATPQTAPPTKLSAHTVATAYTAPHTDTPSPAAIQEKTTVHTAVMQEKSTIHSAVLQEKSAIHSAAGSTDAKASATVAGVTVHSGNGDSAQVLGGVTGSSAVSAVANTRAQTDTPTTTTQHPTSNGTTGAGSTTTPQVIGKTPAPTVGTSMGTVAMATEKTGKKGLKEKGAVSSSSPTPATVKAVSDKDKAGQELASSIRHQSDPNARSSPRKRPATPTLHDVFNTSKVFTTNAAGTVHPVTTGDSAFATLDPISAQNDAVVQPESVGVKTALSAASEDSGHPTATTAATGEAIHGATTKQATLNTEQQAALQTSVVQADAAGIAATPLPAKNPTSPTGTKTSSETLNKKVSAPTGTKTSPTDTKNSLTDTKKSLTDTKTAQEAHSKEPITLTVTTTSPETLNKKQAAPTAITTSPEAHTKKRTTPTGTAASPEAHTKSVDKGHSPATDKTPPARDTAAAISASETPTTKEANSRLPPKTTTKTGAGGQGKGSGTHPTPAVSAAEEAAGNTPPVGKKKAKSPPKGEERAAPAPDTAGLEDKTPAADDSKRATAVSVSTTTQATHSDHAAKVDKKLDTRTHTPVSTDGLVTKEVVKDVAMEIGGVSNPTVAEKGDVAQLLTAKELATINSTSTGTSTEMHMDTHTSKKTTTAPTATDTTTDTATDTSTATDTTTATDTATDTATVTDAFTDAPATKSTHSPATKSTSTEDEVVKAKPQPKEPEIGANGTHKASGSSDGLSMSSSAESKTSAAVTGHGTATTQATTSTQPHTQPSTGDTHATHTHTQPSKGSAHATADANARSRSTTSTAVTRDAQTDTKTTHAPKDTAKPHRTKTTTNAVKKPTGTGNAKSVVPATTATAKVASSVKERTDQKIPKTVAKATEKAAAATATQNNSIRASYSDGVYTSNDSQSLNMSSPAPDFNINSPSVAPDPKLKDAKRPVFHPSRDHDELIRQHINCGAYFQSHINKCKTKEELLAQIHKLSHAMHTIEIAYNELQQFVRRCPTHLHVLIDTEMKQSTDLYNIHLELRGIYTTGYDTYHNWS
ncbi:hypothetical protein SARC_08423 [Sphaeroforma arctica JP610]|uniref:PHD-type domain-containing protein n=1 Tax=Sphaeroforma arctica JP610 TaxID=667725 RepID=A0A0L0FR67_9EUKA|nr:hypothetical protein SARC_08423 [Sphaeroforma arctica JP610]KNC79174.1 hypothetical protein SARC_08423 [Sphaeroforma arctica JP610]|eukprot:XP_014153076.1 hypothetical protein SARC_08423 [Sphaeroforma arctica JP610]